MTTDDGLKGLTDRQWYELWNFISSQEIDDSKVAPLPLDYFGNLGRQWLSENVHDSGDGERYQHMRLHGVITGETSKDGCEWIYGDELDSQIDAAILAEKGEV